MTALTTLDNIGIAQLCVFLPSLAVAIILVIRQGFGWFYLVIFSLARCIGAILQLATINDPTNMGLRTGAATLQSIGLAPLLLVMLGLIGRVHKGLRHGHTVTIKPTHLHGVHLVIVVSLILGIIGGTSMSSSVTQAIQHPRPDGTIDYTTPTESQASSALLAVAWGVIVLVTATTATQIQMIRAGEKRLLLAVGLVIPFALVRLIFSLLSSFSSNPDFKSLSGSSRYVNYLIGMSVVMEMVSVIIFEGIGLTVQRQSKPESYDMQMEEGHTRQRYGPYDEVRS